MFPSRSKFRFQIAPSDRQLWAIGLVVVQWSQVEMFMTVVAHGLTEDDPAARAEYNDTPNMKIRHRLLRALTEAKVMEPWRAELLRLVDRIGQTQQERDRIVHGNWEAQGGSLPHDPVANKVFSWQKPRPAFDWKLTYQTIIEVARKIDAISADLFEFMLRAHGGPTVEASGEKHFLSSDALKRISRKPGPSP